MNEKTFHRSAATVLLILGLLQMTADLCKWPIIKGLAAATAASPAPKVFSSVRGLETYSTRFTLEWLVANEEPRKLVLTPEVNEKLRGPYNRRNVYGALLAYGPVLVTDPRTLPLFQSIWQYAICSPGDLLAELGIPRAAQSSLRIRLEPLPGTHLGDLPHILHEDCLGVEQ